MVVLDADAEAKGNTECNIYVRIYVGQEEASMVITILELEGGNHCRPSPSPERDVHHGHSIGGHVAAEKEREGNRGKC